MTAAVVEGATGATEPGADPMLELLQQVGEGDPRLRLLAQLVQARAAESARSPQPSEAEVLEARLARLREAYSELRDHYLRLAAALGACPRCWGEDPRCRDCGGAGTSGFFAPDRDLFLSYVVPAVRRLQARAQVRTTPRAPRAHEAEAQPEG